MTVGLGVLNAEGKRADVGEELSLTGEGEGGRARRGGGSPGGRRPDCRSAGGGRAEEEEGEPEPEDSQDFSSNPRGPAAYRAGTTAAPWITISTRRFCALPAAVALEA